MTDLLSVVIPTFNRALFLRESIGSLFLQPYRSIEILVVDDGSSDDTDDVLASLRVQCRANNITLRSFYQRNQGASAARNIGVKHSNGDYILFLDSDDTVLPHGISVAMKLLASSKLDYVYMPVFKKNLLDKPFSQLLLGSSYDGSDEDLLSYHWHTMGILYAKSFLKRVGTWNEKVRTSDDWEFQVRVKLANGVCQFIDVPIGTWNIHSGPRLSALAYKSSYVSDILAVCQSILHHCALAGRLTGAVKSRLFRRLTRHALEAGAHGDSSLRQQILLTSRPLATGPVQHAFQQWLEKVPLQASDWLLYIIIQKTFS